MMGSHYAAARLNVKLFVRGARQMVGGMASLKPQASPRRARMATHQRLGDVRLPGLDGIDDGMVLMLGRHQDRKDFIERDPFEGDDSGRDERHRIDTLNQLLQQWISCAADNEVVE